VCTSGLCKGLDLKIVQKQTLKKRLLTTQDACQLAIEKLE